MEIFIEEMIKRKKTPSDYLLVVGIVTLAVFLVFLMLFVLMTIFHAFAFIIFLLAVGIAYGAYFLVAAQNVEFEYSLVNTEIDVDKITNKTRRKRLTTASIRGLEAFGTRKNPDFDRYLNNSAVTKIYACREKSADDIFFMVYNQSEKKIMLIFNPSEKVIDQITKRNPQKQFL